MTWTKERGAAHAFIPTTSIIQQTLTNSRISMESGRLEAARPPPSIPPVVDLSNRFNEAASTIIVCPPSQLERGLNGRQLRRKQRMATKRACFPRRSLLRLPLRRLQRLLRLELSLHLLQEPGEERREEVGRRLGASRPSWRPAAPRSWPHSRGSFLSTVSTRRTPY